MKQKVSELKGALLDAAVARVEGYELDEYGDNRTIRENGGAPSRWWPSRLWEQGGPIIERERIQILPANPAGPSAWIARSFQGGIGGEGATALTAAMRAYVASKFGETVDLP